jgi:hypothetical protein
LEQFLPKDWGQAPLAKAEEEREEASATSSFNMVTCSAVLADNGAAGSNSEEVFITKEQEDLLTNDEQEGEQVEVNMKSKPPRCDKAAEVNPQEATPGATIKKGDKLQDVEYNVLTHLKRIPALLSIYDATIKKGDKLQDVEYNVLTHLKRIPALLSIYDALMLVPELWDALVQALLEPERYEVAMATHRLFTNPLFVNEITFDEEDNIVDDGDHNRPLYIEGNVGTTLLRRILVDPGSAVNIMPVRSLTPASFTVDDLEPTDVIICGFDNTSKVILGAVTPDVDVHLKGALLCHRSQHFVLGAPREAMDTQVSCGVVDATPVLEVPRRERHSVTHHRQPHPLHCAGGPPCRCQVLLPH